MQMSGCAINGRLCPRCDQPVWDDGAHVTDTTCSYSYVPPKRQCPDPPVKPVGWYRVAGSPGPGDTAMLVDGWGFDYDGLISVEGGEVVIRRRDDTDESVQRVKAADLLWLLQEHLGPPRAESFERCPTCGAVKDSGLCRKSHPR